MDDTAPAIAADRHLDLGAIVYPGLDQADFTGPYEVLARAPKATFHVLWKERTPVRDMRGLLITPEATFSEAPALDVLLVPGGFGQQRLMEDETVLSFIRTQAQRARFILSVCTGALLCGAAGILRGVRATTHWRALHLLKYFGAVPVRARVVVDGRMVSTAGVTAGIDGALRLLALLRGEQVAQEVQLYMEYAPQPPFRAGTPEEAPPEVVESVCAATRAIAAERLATAERFARRLGLEE